MFAFASSAFLPASLRVVDQCPRVSRRQRHTTRAALSSPDDDVRVRFRRDTDEPKRSFFPETEQSDTALTPNERVLAQVRESMEKFGVDEQAVKAKQPRPFTPIDISRVNPLSAYAGAAGAALISYTAWTALGYLVLFFTTHPMTNEIYIVQRLGAVVRTVLVCLFALGSGISGVTALGILLLAFRTTAAMITGEFRESKPE